MENLEIEFGQGLNVLTGETGAGKSIIIQALSALLGEKMDETVIRSERDSADVEGLFKINRQLVDRLQQAGIEADDEIVVKRRIGRSKRQSSFVNDSMVSLGFLKELGEKSVDLHGQHEHQSLLNVDNHIHLLDSFGNLLEEQKQCQVLYREYLTLNTKLTEATNAYNRLKDQFDLLSYQLTEIEKANLAIGEDDALKKEKELLDGSEKRSEIAGHLVKVLYDDEDSILAKITTLNRALNELVRIDPTLDRLNEEGEKAQVELDEIYRRLFDYREKIDFSQTRLEEILDRLDLINKLKKKYGSTIDEVLNYSKKTKDSLSNISCSEDKLNSMRQEVEQIKTKISESAVGLSRKREKLFTPLAKEVEMHLKELGMEKARFVVVNRPAKDPQGLVQKDGEHYRVSDSGIDLVEFHIAPNPGEEPKPLRKIASGGEISRIMLALKTILAENDQVPIMVFDEIDVGIGGKVAESLGKKLSNLGRARQIICITHLPQIAKYGDDHFQVTKEVKAGRTFTRIKPLNREERIAEIARMLSGDKITDKTLAHAKELLSEKR